MRSRGATPPGLVAIDGTKLNANASREASRTPEQIAADLGRGRRDRGRRGRRGRRGNATGRDFDDDSDSGLRSCGGRRARLRALLDELEAEAAEKEAATGKPIRGRRPTRGEPLPELQDRQRCVTTRSSRMTRPVSQPGRAPSTKPQVRWHLANAADRRHRRPFPRMIDAR